MDGSGRDGLSFPRSLREFQRLFPDDAACAAYLERTRWREGFACPNWQAAGEPFRFADRAGVLRCRKCRRDIATKLDKRKAGRYAGRVRLSIVAD
jgi:hypothetical protein